LDLKETDGDSETVSTLLSTIQDKKTEIEIVKESTKTIEEIQISLKSQIEEANAKEAILNEKTSDVTEDLEALLEQYQVCHFDHFYIFGYFSRFRPFKSILTSSAIFGHSWPVLII